MKHKSKYGDFKRLSELLLSGQVDWPALVHCVPELGLLDQCAQSPLHHAEGDVGIHTRMCLMELYQLPEWKASSPDRQLATALAVLFHDIGKPKMTKIEEDGTISSRGHSAAGAKIARQILWEMDAPVGLREQVCRVAMWHQIPFFAGLKEDRQDIKRLSLSIDLSFLSMCAKADALGRFTKPEKARLETLDHIELFDLLAQEENVWDRPLQCAGAWERELWLEKPEGSIDPSFALYEQPQMTMNLFCGLPASGKSTLAEQMGLPIEGFDLAREAQDLIHGESEGSSSRYAKEQAKKRLRDGESFIFDITALSKDTRLVLLNLARQYGAATRLIHCETSYSEFWQRNAKRDEHKRLPEKALSGMLSRWNAPTQVEAGEVIFVKNGQCQPVWGGVSESAFKALLSPEISNGVPNANKAQKKGAGAR